MWNYSGLELASLALGAVLIGVNKTGMPGIGPLPVALLALAFPAGLSTGMQLIMLCCGDLIAVLLYRRGANPGIILRMLPCALIGLAIGSRLLHFAPDMILRQLIGAIIIILALFGLFKERLVKSDTLMRNWVCTAFFGILAGFTTQVANAAGPVMAVYLLTLRLDKDEFIRTNVWFFMILNWLKMPLFIYEGRVGMEALYLVLPVLPLIGAGAALGVLFVKKAPQRLFELTVQVLVILAALRLIFG